MAPFAAAAVVFMALIGFAWGDIDTGALPIYSIEVVNQFPHDPDAYTQGLLYSDNATLFESTGGYGYSSVRRVALATGKVEAIHTMDDQYFGQGLTLFGQKLVQVIWETTTGFVYEKTTLSQIGTLSHQMSDGWGLATDGKVLFGSDGSPTLYHIDPCTYKVIEKYVVKYNGKDVNNLCELEYVNGEVWATLWETDCIARISSKDGRMLGWIYLPTLRGMFTKSINTGDYVLNGIAWDAKQNRIFVTGTSWPKLFEIKVVPMEKTLDGDIEKLCMHPRWY